MNGHLRRCRCASDAFLNRLQHPNTRTGFECRLLKKLQLQGRREEETGAYWVVREDFRRPRTPQMGFFSSLPTEG
jgi:hypothetical protein